MKRTNQPTFAVLLLLLALPTMAEGATNSSDPVEQARAIFNLKDFRPVQNADVRVIRRGYASE